MVCTQAVLEPGVICSGVDQICETELLYPAQPLHLWRAYQSSSKVVKLDTTGPWTVHAKHQIQRILQSDILKLVHTRKAN